MRLLLTILRAQRGDGAIEEGELESALTLAEEEHVLPWAASCLRSQHASLPPAIAYKLNQIKRDAAITAFYWCTQLQGALRALHEAGIKVVPLKGPLLAEQIYGSATLRTSRDLDLLVSQADIARAVAVLVAIGFVPDSADDYHRPWRRQSTTVELHHDVENPLAFNFHVESVLGRTRPGVFQGQPCQRLAPEDELLFLCLHAARHRYERLSLIVDLQLAFEKLPGDVTGWHPRQEVAGLNNLLTLGLIMARRLQPDFGVSLSFDMSRRQTEHLEKLADRLWSRLLTQPSEPLDWRAAHSFFVEIELPGWPRLRRRYRHLKIFSSRVIEPDYAFAARFGLGRTWQVRVLRPLRLLSEWLDR
jgi:hypothetical protein